MSFRSLCWLVAMVVCIGCQSVPQRLPRKVFVTTKTANGLAAPRETFKRGEFPVVVVQGYGEQKVVVEIVRNGRLILSKEYDIPGPRNEVRDDGIGYATHGGMGLERRATLIRHLDQYLIRLTEAPPLGFYQVAVKVNGEQQDLAKFSVLGNND